MRIGLVCPYDLSKPGGVQAQVLGLAKALRGGGDDVLVIGPGLPPDVPGSDMGPSVGVRANGSVAPISLRPAKAALRSATSSLDVLHVHEPFMPTVGFASLRAGPPVVATFHAAATGVGNLFYRLVGGSAGSLLGPNVRAVTAVSPTAAAALPQGIDPVIIPNGVDIDSFRPSGNRNPKQVAFLGRDEPRKGLDVLIGAWSVVLEHVQGAELVVMGADRGTEGVTWMGRVDDSTKARVLGSSGVYVAPNTGSESFGVILVEGMAAGAAVVASDLDAFMDVGGDAIRYFETGDPDSLAVAVIDLLDDEQARASLGAAGLARAKDFDWRAVAKSYRGLYEMAVS